MGKRHLWELAAAALLLTAALVIAGTNGLRWSATALACALAALAALVVYRFAREDQRALDQAAKAVQYREQLLDTFSDSVDDIFIMLRDGGRQVEYISPNIQRLMGVSAEQLRQNPRLFRRLSAEEGDTFTRKEVYALPCGGRISRERAYIRPQTGERRWYRETLYRVVVQDAERLILVLSDRTLEQHMTGSLRHALEAAKSANEAKSHFLANMSHDIRTPLNAVQGFAALLGMDAGDPDKVRDYARKITVSSRHLLGLVNDVLDMSKIESGKTSLHVAEFHLPDLLEEIRSSVLPRIHAKDQQFDIRMQGRAPESLMGDRQRICQILLNLLSNAVQYTPEGGQIVLLIQNLPRVSPHYARLRFVVQDNGIGMSQEFIEKIFEPFTRAVSSVTNTVQGAGLGLAIAKNLVDLMGGVISVDSAPGRGTVFTVEMEFAAAQRARDNQFWQQHGVTRILVVDDNEDVCLEVQGMMSGTGVGVAYTTSGLTAAEWVGEAHRRGEDYHAVLLDWQMPVIDGLETARRIREQVGPELPILIQTAHDWSGMEQAGREAGVDLFLPKPFFVSVFQDALRQLWDAPAGEAGDPAPNFLEGMRFLVAEDNDLNAEILSEMLELEGAGCERAVNGLEAVRRFEASRPGDYDMILMDVQMPEMNGYEAARRIRAGDHPRARSIPIIAMTANAFAEDVRSALDAGMDAHVAKPIDLDVLRAAMEPLLDRAHNPFIGA